MLQNASKTQFFVPFFNVASINNVALIEWTTRKSRNRQKEVPNGRSRLWGNFLGVELLNAQWKNESNAPIRKVVALVVSKKMRRNVRMTLWRLLSDLGIPHALSVLLFIYRALKSRALRGRWCSEVTSSEVEPSEYLRSKVGAQNSRNPDKQTDQWTRPLIEMRGHI